MFVLDTNVISALRRPHLHPPVVAWARRSPPTDHFTTAVSIAEIEQGIRRKERTDADQGKALRRWFDERVLPSFADRVLPFDLAAARVLGRYPVPESAPYDDALIAAVAESRGMIVVTRNVRHFAPLGVRTINPWDTRQT